MALQLEVDHGLTVPLSVYCPEPGDAWPAPVIPVLVNVIQYPSQRLLAAWPWVPQSDAQ